MESIIRVLFALTERGSDEVDKAWIKATESFFTVFLVIMVGVPILAHFSWTLVIFLVMVSFFMVWIVATFRVRNILGISLAGLIYGVPAEGNASNYAKTLLTTWAKSSFLVLIWGEIWMATYLHFPSFAKEWWMIGSAIAVMMVIIPTVIYALATGHMLEGPWHKPVLIVAIVLLATVMFSAIPTGVWTSMGINTISFQIPETTERAQAIRSKSYDNLVGKKLKEMQTLQQKVERGDVLTSDELLKLETLEAEAKVTPQVPDNAVTTAVKQLPSTVTTMPPKHIVLLVAGLLLLYWLFNRKSAKAFWLAVLLLVGYAAVVSGFIESATQTSFGDQIVSKLQPPIQSSNHFIERSDWGSIGARKIAQDEIAAGNITPIWKIEKGQYNGKRPVPLLGMNGGDQITLIIEPDPDNELKDLIIEQNVKCPGVTPEGVWSCTTAWRSRGNEHTKGSALLLMKDGVRTITLHDQSGQQVISFQIEHM